MRSVFICYVGLIAMSILAGFIIPSQAPISLGKGDLAPDFTARTISGQDVHLASLAKKGNVVLLFYQGFWCTGCHKSLSHFREELSKITKKGGHTIAITPTPLSGNPTANEKEDADVSIVIDSDLSIMKSYGIVHESTEDYIRGHKSYGMKNFSFIPATYIVDENMRIKFAHVDPHFTINAFVDSLLIHN